MHLYNPTAPLFRRVVYGKDRGGHRRHRGQRRALFVECAASQPETDWRFEYSPETFTVTELDFARRSATR